MRRYKIGVVFAMLVALFASFPVGSNAFGSNASAADGLTMFMPIVSAKSANDSTSLAAKASMTPQIQYVNDTAGTVFTVTIHNTGTASIGSVEVGRPSDKWKIAACPLAPQGWTATNSSNTACQYRSAATTSDDIMPGQSVSTFQIKATTSSNSSDFSDEWNVTVSKNNKLDDDKDASSESPGLKTYVYSFEILDAVVANGPATPGSACPTANKQAPAGSTGRTIIICGKNRSSSSATLTSSYATLQGTFIASHGSFSSGKINAKSASSVVLGNWANVKITSSTGSNFTVQAKVGASSSKTSPLTTLNGYSTGSLNPAPTAQATTATTNEDTTSGAITLSASDPNGDATTFSIVSAPSHGTLSAISSPSCSGTVPKTCTATLTYTPAADYNGPDSFTYKANDGTSDSNVATVSITVTPVNDAPTASAQSVSTDKNTALPITLSGSDVDDDNLTFSIVTAPAHGALGSIGSPNCSAVNTCTASVTYTPANNYSGSDSFTFKVNDGTVDSPAATVTISINTTNIAPVASGQSVTTAEDTALPITLSASDGDDNDLTFSIVAAPAHGTLGTIGTPDCSAVNTCTASVTYTPNNNYNGSDSFTFKVNDGTVNSNVATVSITVTPVNDAPVADAQSVTTDKNTAATITLSGSDVDNDNLTFSIVTPPTHGTLGTIGTPDCSVGTTCTASVTYTPANNYSGSDSFTFKVNDGTVDSPTATISISVNQTNVAPVASGQSVTTAEDTALPITLSASDGDDNDLTFSIVAAPAHGTLGTIGTPDCTAVNTCTASVTYTPAANYNGPDSFTFKVNDGTVDSNAATISITVTPVNDAPVADAQSVSTDKNTPATITLSGSDVDNDNLTFLVVTGPTHGTLGTFGTLDCSVGNTCTASLTYTPNNNYSGSDSFTFKVNDGTVDSNVATISISVNQTNVVPVASGQSVTTAEDTALPITLSASDGDDNDLTFSIVAAPAHGTLGTIGTPDCSAVNTCTASVTYTPAANYNGPDSFTFKANDGTVDSNVATVSITVTPVNDAPVASAQSVNTDKNTALPITLSGSDVDNDDLTFSIVTAPTHGTLGTIGTPDCSAVNTCTASVTYTPTAGYFGPDSFTFKVNDGTVDSAAATVTITVNQTNAAPVASGQSVTTAEDTAKSITLSASDEDDNNLTFSIVAAPAHGTLGTIGTPDCSAVNTCTATVTYTPAANYNGPDSFTFKANDGTLDSNVATVSITITPVNDAPTAVNDTYSVAEDTNLSVNAASGVLANDTDVENDALTAILVTGPAHGTLTLNPDGSFSYTPVANYNGTDTFTYKANDGSLDSNVATATITVTPVNDPPTNTVPAAQTVNEDTNLVFSAATSNAISIADIDAGSSPVKMSLDVQHGTLTLASTAGLTFVDGTSNGSGSVHVTGTLANINTALNGLIYKGLLNYNSTRGSETLTIVTNDQGNTGAGGALSDTDTVAITVNPVNDAPAATAKTFTVQANMKITGLSGLLTGATDPDTGDTGYTAAFSVNDVLLDNCPNGTISNINAAAGSFDFDPPAGATGTCTLKYRVNDSGNPGPAATSAYASITITINGPVIWFVNASAPAGGNGRLSSPFNTLAAADAVDAANHRIFLYAGTYANGIALNTGEWLIGQGVTGSADFDTLMGITPPTGTIARPTIGSGVVTVQNTVTLNTNTVVKALTLSTGANTGLNDPAGAITGVTVDQTSVSSTTGTAVLLSDLGGTLTLRSVSANGAPNGISLTNTTGSFTVTGDGTNTTRGGNSSGGTIANTAGANGATTGSGVYLSNAQNVTLRRITINGTNQNFGIRGLNVTNFTLEYATVGGVNGNSTPDREGSVIFNNLFGTNAVTGVVVSGSVEDNFRVENSSGTMNALNVSASSFLNNSTATGGNNGFRVAGTSSANMTATLDGSLFQGNRTDAINSDAGDSSTVNMTITNNTIIAGTGGNNRGNIGIDVTTALNGKMTFKVEGNKIGTDGTTNAPLLNTGINIFNGTLVTSGTPANISGTVKNNTVVNAGAGQSGFGIRLFNQGYGTMAANVSGNNVSNVGLDYGILVEVSSNSGSAAAVGTTTVAVTNNTSNVLAGGLDAIRVQARGRSVMNARISGNVSSTHGTGFFGLEIRQAAQTIPSPGGTVYQATFNLEGLTTGLQTDHNLIVNYLNSQNPGIVGGADEIHSQGITGVPSVSGIPN